MAITPTAVTVKWDGVPGSTTYDIYRDTVKVSTVGKNKLTGKVRTSTNLGVLPGGHLWDIVARPSGEKQSLNMKLEG